MSSEGPFGVRWHSSLGIQLAVLRRGLEINAEGVRQFQPGVAATPDKRAVTTRNAEGVRELTIPFKLCKRFQRYSDQLPPFPGVEATPG